MTRPRLLDLMCSAGGATRGYQLAGFHVTGVDIEPQPRYCGDSFIQADALTFPLDGFDAIHASPPCQLYSAMSVCRPGLAGTYPDLIGPIRKRLQASGLPWVIENVVGAPLRHPVLLCGSMFDLDLYRHRLFECSFPPPLVMHPPHGVPGSYAGHWKPGQIISVSGNCAPIALARKAMGIDWMTRDELKEAIPPSYATFIGGLLLAHLSRVAVTPDTDPSGVPTGSSPTAPAARSGGQVAPGGSGPTATLDARSEAVLAEESGTARPAGYVPGEVPAPPRTYRPAFVDNDARPAPTTRETVPVQEGVL